MLIICLVFREFCLQIVRTCRSTGIEMPDSPKFYVQARKNDTVSLERGIPSVLTGASSRMYSASRREISQTKSSRGSKSRNKVSVGEPAEGSLSKVISDVWYLGVLRRSNFCGSIDDLCNMTVGSSVVVLWLILCLAVI
ncbi:hypothetical protein T08_9637 [Trichinella sp. T8]|nr:hypothetical protein T08_9637 [Trichinella sp. T8]